MKFVLTTHDRYCKETPGKFIECSKPEATSFEYPNYFVARKQMFLIYGSLVAQYNLNLKEFNEAPNAENRAFEVLLRQRKGTK